MKNLNELNIKTSRHSNSTVLPNILANFNSTKNY